MASLSSPSSTLNYENNSTRDLLLPDDVLQHIFSYLDMKDAIQTSILAKRWRYFWTSLLVLNLDEKVFNSNPNYGLCGFPSFVTRVLLLRDKSIIHTFHLRVGSCDITDDMDAWMQCVLNFNVQQLSIQYYSPSRENFDMPFVFKSKSLTKINLGSVGEDDHHEYTHGTYRLEVRIPNLINLPILTKLRFEAICDLHTKDLNKLFAGCPVLETLEIINCEFDFSNSLRISSLQLKHLVIQFGGLTNPYDGRIPNPISITVSCPNLISFSCQDYMTRIYHLESLCKLEITDMSMETQDSIYNPEFLVNEPNRIEVCDIESMINTLEWLYNVKFLTLYPTLLRVLSESPKKLKQSHIQFRNLKYLKVSTPMAKTYLPAIMYLLKSSPKIETFVIQILSREVHLANKFENWGEKLSLKHLKSIGVRCFEGSINEMEFLKVMLKEAVILEKIIIFTSKEFSAKNQGRLKLLADELLTCPRASLYVEIIFCKSST